MTTPTLTEARRALLELQQPEYAAYCCAEVAMRLALVNEYLDSLVPLNVENNSDIVTATIGSPVNYNEIVRPANNYVLMSQHRDPLAADSNRVFFATSQERDEFAVRLNDRLNDELDAVTKAGSVALNDLINRMNGTCGTSCGKCFKCRNGGRGKYMEHPDSDPTKRCDGAA